MATNLYVDSSWSSCSAGDPVIMGDDILTFGVDAFADIQSAVNAASASEATTINVYAGTYADNIYFLDSKTGGQKADITIQAADGVAKADVNISGSIQIGKRGSESWGGIDSSVTVVENWDSDVTIQGVTLSGANVIADYCEDVNIANCVVDGANVKFSYAVPTVTNSDFKNNAYIQTKGTSSGDLTVTGGSFTDSRINITSASTSGSAKEAVIENVTFNSTIPADQTADSSFYAIRTKGDTVVVQGCTFNIDSELADSTAVPDEAGDWSVLRMRTATSTLPWTIEDCTVNFTENAANLEGLNFITNDSTSANAANIMNVTNLTATTYDDEGNQLTGDAAVAALAGDSEGFVKVDGEVYDDGTVVSLSTIYINSAWDGSTTKIADGIVYGVNAFNNIDAVFALYGDKDHRNTETNTVQFLSDTTAVATGKKFFYSNVDVLFTAAAGVTVDLSTYSRAYLMGYYTVENYQGAPANVPTFTIDDNVTVNFFSNDGYRILMVGQAIDNPDDVDGNGDATRDPGAAKLIVNGTINAGQVYTAPYSTIETGTHGVITYTAGYKADAMIIRSNSEIDINGDGNHTLLQFHPNYVSNQGGTLKLRDAYGSTGQFGTSDQTKDLVNTDANVILDNSILYASTLVLSDTKGTVSLTNGSTLAKTNGEALGGSNAGTINIEGASKLVLGTVTNTGTINVIGNGNTVTATALSGAGSVTFKNAALDNKISLAGSQNVRFLGTTSIANPNLADLTGNFYVGTYGLDEAEDSELTINGDVTFGLTYVGADDEGASGKTAKLDIAAGKTLTVGSLYARKSSTITVNTGAKLLSGYGSLQGTINVDGGVVKFSSETVKHDMSISATNGGVIDLGYTEGQTDRRHTYSLTNGSILTVGILYNTDIAITMDSSSTLALAPRAQDVADGTKLAITVTVDSAFTGVKKLIDMNAKYDYTTQTYTDTGSVAMTVDDYKRIVTNWNDNFTVIDNDLYLSNVDVDDVYVNSDWAEAGYKYGEAFTYGDKTLYYGINAFSSVKDAYDSGNMNGATTNVIKTLGEQTTGNPDWAEIVVESDGAYTLTGGDHGLVPYFEIDNTEGTLTTMTIEDADLMMEKFGARRNGLVRVTNSTIEVEHPIGSNATTTIYYNGNVSLTDTTFSVWQTTVTGVLTVSGQSSTYYSPWQTQVWFTGQITVEDGATWTTGAFGVGGSKTSAGYISRRNTDFAEGVNVATFTVNNATLDAGSDYRSGTYGMEIGTYADSTAAFNVLNDSTATLYINAGATSTFKKVQFGQYATVSVDNSVLNIGGSANAENFLNEGSLTLSNGATLNATIAATNTGAIALDVTSTLNGTTLDNASGTITIDATGFTSGVKKVIDLSQAAALTNVAFKEDTAAEGVKLALGADGDVVVYKLATSALYVNSDWAGSQTGAEVGGEGSGKFYGINAFDNFKSALSVAQDNAGGTISFDTMGYTYAAPQTDDAYAATISVPGTYVLTDGNGALLNYELEVNVNKDTENDYALTIDDAFITLTKLTTRYNTDVTITDSRVDFNQFQGGSAYLSIYNGSALTISGSTVGFDPHQSGKASPDELPDAGTGAGSYWNWAPRVVVYGETRITDSKMYVYVGQGVQTGFDILGNSDTEVKNSTVSLAQLNVGNKSSEFQTKRLGQNDDANNLNASLLIDNSTILNTQYRGDNTTKNGIIVGENDSVKGAMTVTNGSLVDFTKLTYGGDREIGLQVRSGSTVSISSNSTMKMPKVSNSGTINLDGSATLSATNGIANDGIIKLTGTNTLTGAITGAGTLKFDGATINDAITASTNAGVFSGTNAINADLTIDTYKQGYDTALNTADSTTTVTGAKLTAHNFYIGSNKLGGVTNKLVATNGASLLSDQPHNTTTFYVRGNGIMDLTDSTLGGYYKDGVGYDPEGTKINVVHLMNYGAVSLTNSNAYFDGFVVYGGDINDTDGTDGFTSASFAATDSNITIAGVNGSKFTVGGITTSAIVGGKGSKGTGDVTLSNSTFTVGTNFVVGFDKNGSVTMSDGSTLSVANGMIGLGLDAGNGTLTVDATSSVNAKDVNVGANGTISITVGGTITAETFTNGGTITIDATGITGYADVITVTGGDAQMGGTINLITDEGSKLDVIKHSNGSVSVGIIGDDIYFNSDWSTVADGTPIKVDGETKTVHKGVDAFAELGDATATAGKTLHFTSDSATTTAANGMLDGSTLVKAQDAAADVTVSLSGASFVQQKGDLTIGSGVTLAATKLMHFAKDTTITVDGTFQSVSNAYLYAGKMIVNGSLTGDDVFLNGSGENTYELTANGAIDVAKLRVGANATLDLEGADVTTTSGMSVTAESGTVNVNEHATIDGGLTNGGTINVADGKALSLTGAVDNSGKINLGTDSTLNTAGATFTNKSAGEITLNGTLSNVTGSATNEGTINVGTSTLSFLGDGNKLTNAAGANVVISVGGLLSAASLENNGTITVDVSEAGSDYAAKVISVSGGAITGAGSFVTAGNVYANGGEYWVSDATQDVLYVNSAWKSGYSFGDQVAEGQYYGINAFGDMDEFSYKSTGANQSAKIAAVKTINLTAGAYGSSSNPYTVFYAGDNDVLLTGTGTVKVNSGRLYLMTAVAGESTYADYTANVATTTPKTFTIDSGLTLQVSMLKAGDVVDSGDARTGGVANLVINGTVNGLVFAAPYSTIDVNGKVISTADGSAMTSSSYLRPHGVINVNGSAAAGEAGSADVQFQSPVTFTDAGTLNLKDTHAKINRIRIYEAGTLTEGQKATITLDNSYVERLDDSAVDFFVYENSTKGFDISLTNKSTLDVTHTTFNPNANTAITVSDSTLIADTVTNNGSITVSGESLLTIGTLTGNAIVVSDDATLTGSSIGGALTIDAGKTVTVGNAGLAVETLTNNGTINLTVDTSAFTETTYKLIDITGDGALDTAKITVNGSAFSNGAQFGDYTLLQWDNDIILSKSTADTTTLYVSTEYVGDYGTDLGGGKILGVNAFSNLFAALDNRAADTFTIEVEDSNTFTSATDVEYILTSEIRIVAAEGATVVQMLELQSGKDFVWYTTDSYSAKDKKFTVTLGENVTLKTTSRDGVDNGGVIYNGYLYAPNFDIYGTLDANSSLWVGSAWMDTVDESTTFNVYNTGRLKGQQFCIHDMANITVNGAAENANDPVRLTETQVAMDYTTLYSGTLTLNNTTMINGAQASIDNAFGSYIDQGRTWDGSFVVLNNSAMTSGSYLKVNGLNSSYSTHLGKAGLTLNNGSIFTGNGTGTDSGNNTVSGSQSFISLNTNSKLKLAKNLTVTDGSVTVVDSTLDIGGVLTNNGTITVSGDSLLTIGTLTGTITVDGNAVLTGSSVGGAGNIEVAAGKVLTVGDATETATSFGAVTNAGEIDIYGALVDLGAITNNGTINMDWQDKLTFSGFTGSAINFNMIDYTGVETATKVLDYTGTGTMDAADYQAMLGMNATDFNKYFEVGTDDDANDLFLKVGGATKLYVGGEGTGHYAPTSVGLSDAVTAAKGLDAELTVINGTFSDLAVLNDVVTLIEDGTFSKNIVAGQSLEAASARKKVTVGEDEDVNTNLTINSGTYQYVYGADRLTLGSLDHFGSVNLTINGGMFNKAVVGGIAYAQTSTSAMADLIGDINMTITGGTFKEYVYGGCIASSKNLGAHTTIEGDITMTIDVAGDKTVTFEKNIIVGSMGSGYVSKNLDTGDGGNVELVLTGNGTINLSGETSQIWGGCSSDQYFTNSSTGARRFETNIEGNRTLTFTGFTGTLNCNTIRGFNVFNATESNFTLNDGVNLNDIINWDISADSTISGKFYSNFAGDTLNVDLANWDNEAKAIFDDASKFSGMDENLTVTFGDAVASYQDGVWTAAEAGVKLYLEDNKVMLGIA